MEGLLEYYKAGGSYTLTLNHAIPSPNINPPPNIQYSQHIIIYQSHQRMGWVGGSNIRERGLQQLLGKVFLFWSGHGFPFIGLLLLFFALFFMGLGFVLFAQILEFAKTQSLCPKLILPLRTCRNMPAASQDHG